MRMQVCIKKVPKCMCVRVPHRVPECMFIRVYALLHKESTHIYVCVCVFISVYARLHKEQRVHMKACICTSKIV